MGVYGCDLISGDSTLEFTMDLLTKAGIGPERYEERKKFFMIAVSDYGGKHFVGRHMPEEYEEFWACLDAAADQGVAIQRHFAQMFTLVNATRFISESSLDKGGPDGGIVGLGIHIMIMVMMQAGCLLEPLRQQILQETDVWSRPIPQRAAHFKNFMAAVRQYVPPRYDHVTTTLATTSDGSVTVLLDIMLKGTAVTYRPLSLVDLADREYPDAVEDNLAIVTPRAIVIPAFEGCHVLKTTRDADVKLSDLEKMHVEAQIERERNPTMYRDTRVENEKDADPKALVGKRIALNGLQSRRDLNGSAGLARTYNQATGRYAVELDCRGAGERMAVKPENLMLL